MYDVIIIGAGIAGAATARELTRYQLKVLVLEAGSDVSSGTTRANSGIVHGGYDPVPGTLKAKYNLAGSLAYPQMAEELGFHFMNNGSLVVAFSEEERPHLEMLLARGIENGVSGLRIVEAEELRAMEPNLSSEVVCALHVPTGGIVNPYDACLSFMENAIENGAELQLLTRVDGLSRSDEGFCVATTRIALDGAETEGPVLQAEVLVNAAGVHAAEVCGMLSEHPYRVNPRSGEYQLLDRDFGSKFAHTVFQTPTANGKGVLVTPTTGGNLLVGPDAIPHEDPDDTSTDTEGLAKIMEVAAKTWPDLPRGGITNFAGMRASSPDTGDFILGEAEDVPGFFQFGAFDSPGLTAAPAVAADYARQIAERLGAAENPAFNPRRTPRPRYTHATPEEWDKLVVENPAYGRIVCRCETVSEGEIVDAIYSPVPALTADAIKWRTRAGMGRCQGGFCLPLVAEIIAREEGVDIADVCKNKPGSAIALGHRGCIDALPHVVFEKGGSR